ncbi:MAG: protein kinase [Planctomycetes bacterium]|nr:protein kinase [Planctomycetota bacterium]
MHDEDPTASKPARPNGGAAARFTQLAAGLRGGDRVGPYKILESLGEGGFAVVYLAEQTEPIRRRVALKVIKPGMDTKQVIARFEAERQALAVMDHPNVAKVFDAGVTPPEAGSRPYFVMEHVPGVSITEHCDRQRLNIEERLELFMQVCEAVQHAHQKGIIHRDLKPSNILVTVKNGQAVPKVIDFGVAKALHQRLTEKTLFTEQGQLIGTPEYMSPEQAEMTAQDIDTRTDIYSLGVLLYELLTGALPFDPTTLRQAAFAEIQRIIREQEPPKPSTRLSTLREASGDLAAQLARRRGTDARSLLRDVRGDLDWITMTALEKDRARRYASATELAADVSRFLRDDPVEARPPEAWYRLRKLVSRHRIAVGIGLLLAGMMAAGVAFQVVADRIRLQSELGHLIGAGAIQYEIGRRAVAVFDAPIPSPPRAGADLLVDPRVRLAAAAERMRWQRKDASDETIVVELLRDAGYAFETFAALDETLADATEEQRRSIQTRLHEVCMARVPLVVSDDAMILGEPLDPYVDRLIGAAAHRITTGSEPSDESAIPPRVDAVAALSDEELVRLRDEMFKGTVFVFFLLNVADPAWSIPMAATLLLFGLIAIVNARWLSAAIVPVIIIETFWFWLACLTLATGGSSWMLSGADFVAAVICGLLATAGWLGLVLVVVRRTEAVRSRILGLAVTTLPLLLAVAAWFGLAALASPA